MSWTLYTYTLEIVFDSRLAPYCCARLVSNRSLIQLSEIRGEKTLPGNLLGTVSNRFGSHVVAVWS